MKIDNRTLSDQVKQVLIEMIKDMEFMDKLPSEQKLAKQFGVSRNTVHEALKAMEYQGMVIFRRGTGTFVTRYSSNDSIRYNIASLDSTTKIISEHGYKPGTINLNYEMKYAPINISNKLGSKDEIEVLYIERVRTANEMPIIYVEDYIISREGMLDDFNREKGGSLLSYMNKYNPISFSNCSIHTVISDERLMGKLSLDEPKALLLLEQIHYSSKGEALFYSDSYFLTEKLEFNIIRRYNE
ncbi:MAG: GntR family transcriptional regulator [Gudongella sp.]|nr:GntR family transcriptional regulator [Gudongella sp.]